MQDPTPAGGVPCTGNSAANRTDCPASSLLLTCLMRSRFQHHAVLVLCPPRPPQKMPWASVAVVITGTAPHTAASARLGYWHRPDDGQHRHRKAAAFVQYHHRRVRRLAAAVRRNGPHRNAHGSHKNKGVALRKLQGGPPEGRRRRCRSGPHCRAGRLPAAGPVPDRCR